MVEFLYKCVLHIYTNVKAAQDLPLSFIPIVFDIFISVISVEIKKIVVVLT